MNYTIALALFVGVIIYIAVELGWGGSYGDWRDYQRPKQVGRKRRRPPRDWSWFQPKTPSPQQPDRKKIPEKV